MDSGEGGGLFGGAAVGGPGAEEDAPRAGLVALDFLGEAVHGAGFGGPGLLLEDGGENLAAVEDVLDLDLAGGVGVEHAVERIPDENGAGRGVGDGREGADLRSGRYAVGGEVAGGPGREGLLRQALTSSGENGHTLAGGEGGQRARTIVSRAPLSGAPLIRGAPDASAAASWYLPCYPVTLCR